MGDCREYQGHRTKQGYGRRGNVYIHRMVWERANGPIPDGMCVMHKCDNPACFLYEHLRLGTHADNSADMVAKGRGNNGKVRDHCVHGHVYDEENTLLRSDRPGHRECRTCRREASARYRGGQ